MVNLAHLVGIGIAALTIALDGVVGPAVPQRQHRLHELLGTRIALGMRWHGRIAVVARLAVEHRGHHIPAHSPAGDMIQRAHQPGGVEGSVEGARDRADQPDPLGGTAHGGECGQRLEMPVEAIFHAAGTHAVGEEQCIQLAALGGAGQGLIVGDIAEALGAGVGMAPCRAMVAIAHHEQIEVQLLVGIACLHHPFTSPPSTIRF